MKESDYITSGNVHMVRVLLDVLRHVHPDGKDITDDEYRQIRRAVNVWEMRLAKRIDRHSEKAAEWPLVDAQKGAVSIGNAVQLAGGDDGATVLLRNSGMRELPDGVYRMERVIQ